MDLCCDSQKNKVKAVLFGIFARVHCKSLVLRCASFKFIDAANRYVMLYLYVIVIVYIKYNKLNIYIVFKSSI